MGSLTFYLLLIALTAYIYIEIPHRNQRFLLLAIILYYLFFWALNHFAIPLKGTSVDAMKFHYLALEVSEGQPWVFGLGAQLFSGWIALLYSLFGISHAAASLVSICMVAGSFCFMAKIVEELKLSPHSLWGVVIFLILPSMVFRSVTTLREAYLVFLFSGACLAYARFLIHRNIAQLFIFVISFLALMVLHKAMIIFGMIVVPLLLVCVRPDAAKGLVFRSSRILILAILIIPMVSYVNLLSLPSADLPKGLRAANAVITLDTEYVGRILNAKGEKEANASYDLIYNTDSWIGIVGGVTKSYLYYLFKPFPGDVNSWLDVFAIVENLIFLLFLSGSIYCVFGTQNYTVRSIIGLFLVLFVINSIIWGLGTTNWGTASRHHLVHHWIVFLFGGAGFLAWARHTVHERG